MLEFPSSVEFTGTLSWGYNDRIVIKGHWTERHNASSLYYYFSFLCDLPVMWLP